ncbi:NAD-dependent malic enzyme, mitochondrial [Tulasnella sp. JGI-2019a]|nr:NAD-dependent malic enzyme, mitochondrial [Tulasnella sp. JGI-2019a]
MAPTDLESIKKFLAEKHEGDNSPVYKVSLTDEALLANPKWNKGTAFTPEERETFNIVGRLPSRVNTLNEQCARAWEQYKSRENNLAKNTFLQSLKAQNWTLYYSFLGRNLKEVLPVVYTPTVRRKPPLIFSLVILLICALFLEISRRYVVYPLMAEKTHL